MGWIVEITEQGIAVVDFPDNPAGPIAARSVLASRDGPGDLGSAGVPVLLAFENRDPSMPIIVGVVRDTLFPPPPPLATILTASRPQTAVLDQQKIVLDAREEIILRCGKGSITLTKEGKIFIKGTHLVTRSSGQNKIQGACVKIN